MSKEIKNFIEEGEKEFEECFYEGERNSVFCKKHKTFATPIEFKNFIKYRQISLIKMIVEMGHSLKKNCNHDSHSHCMEENCYIFEKDGYNQGIIDFIKELKELTDGK